MFSTELLIISNYFRFCEIGQNLCGLLRFKLFYNVLSKIRKEGAREAIVKPLLWIDLLHFILYEVT